MLEIIDITTMSIGMAGAASCVLLWMLIAHLRKRDILLAQAQARIDALTSNLSALCAGTIGVNKRLNQLEQHNRALQMRQDHIENQEQNDCSYGDAIQMVRHGATAPRLIEELGLRSNEADLIVMLHGMKKLAS